MPRYWVIAPVESDPPELFDKVWQFDLSNNLLSIGWKDLGDVSKMTREELAAAVAQTYPEKPPGTRALVANMIWAFYHEIQPGDYVIARRGRKALAGVGSVSGAAFYKPGVNPVLGHPNFLSVSWDPQPRNKAFLGVVFPMHTLAEIAKDKFDHFLMDSDVPVDQPEVSSPIEDRNEFVLEKYLEEFIVSNFQAIFKGDLIIHRDAEENVGQQYTTDIGPIDILAFEQKSNSFVVIELKKGRASDQVVGQILRYMGWVKKNLCTNGQRVKGLIIGRNRDPKLSYALEMTENIDVRYYSVSFKLNENPPE